MLDKKLNGFACNDTYPNIDGNFELVPNPEISRRPKQNFAVQIKGTSIEKVDAEGVKVSGKADAAVNEHELASGEAEVTFLNEDNTVLFTEEVEYGKVPSYAGETPTKADF